MQKKNGCKDPLLISETKEDQGKRPYMEDKNCKVLIGKDMMFFGIFDGHGGAAVAEICAANFPQIMMQGLQMSSSADFACILHSTFYILDQLVAKVENVFHVGSTVVVTILTPNAIWFANAGDSMAMVCYMDGRVELVSEEHKVEKEKDRIKAEGGVITYDDGCARIYQTLNVSRAIGDHFMKKHVNCQPFVRSISRNFDKVKYVVMASDGIWDVMGPSDIHQIIISHNNTNKAIEQIVDIAKYKGSTDNITITYIDVEKSRSYSN